MKNNTIPPIHPGEHLLEDFLKPLEISPYQLAKSIGVGQTRISEIIHAKRSITVDTALRLSRFFGTDEKFWLNLQQDYDIEVALHSPLLARIEREVHPLAA